MNPSPPDTSPSSLGATPFPTFDTFTTFEQELAGLAAKLLRWSSRSGDAPSHGSSHGRSRNEFAMPEADPRENGPDGC